MQNRISVFSKTGELSKGLVIDSGNDSDKTFRLRLRATAPHSIFNEEGVKEHWVTYYKYPALEKWVYAHYSGDADAYNPGSILIGGPNSRIQKGNSQNQFFKISIDEYLNSNKSRSQFVKALREAVKDTFK